MYDPKSLRAEDFIDHDEVLASLEYANKYADNADIVDQIIEKARQRKGLTHREASVLLACTMPDKIQEMYSLVE